jgi:hypothetical protein
MSTHKARFLDTIHYVDTPTEQVHAPFATQLVPEIVLRAVFSS